MRPGRFALRTKTVDDVTRSVETRCTWLDACSIGPKARRIATRCSSSTPTPRWLGFLRANYDVADDAFRVDCNLFADHLERQREIEQFWLDALGLPQSCLRKSKVNVYSKYSKKKRQNRLPYGTVRVCVHRTEIVQSIFGAIQEYGGFERPEWLDRRRNPAAPAEPRADTGHLEAHDGSATRHSLGR